MGRRLRAALAAVAVVGCIFAPQVGADQSLLDRSVSVSGTTAGPCFKDAGPGPGAAIFEITGPGYGYLTLSLSGGTGDWDIASFTKGRVAAAAATRSADEIASGFVLADEEIRVRVCRNPGAAGSPRVRADFHPLSDPGASGGAQLLRVQTREPADRVAVRSSGLDPAESAGPGYIDVVSFGPESQAELARLGLPYTVLDEELGDHTFRGGPRAARAAGGLPSGRTEYRRLHEYEQEMKDLAAENPGLVRLFTLPHRSLEGRSIMGVEISDDPGAADGEPTFLQLGLHHGREWPAGELTIEWAYELLRGAAGGDVRAQRRLTDTRTLIVPVVNPDGFNVSRESGQLVEDYPFRFGDPRVSLPVQNFEFQRKNCRVPGPSIGDCGAAGEGFAAGGVDNNRNYGVDWGGTGAEIGYGDPTYRGRAPFSEPETKNVRALFSGNQIIAASSQHTFTSLILRPPLARSLGKPPDNALLRRLGDAMGRQSGYKSQPGFDLYTSSGGLDDWAYFSTGAATFTPELGTSDFHPSFAETIREWNGTAKRARGGMRGAFYGLSGFVRRDSGHVVVKGRGPAGGRLTFQKRFTTRTAKVLKSNGKFGKRREFRDRLRTSADVGADGSFVAHINPSTRPMVAKRKRGPRRERWKLVCHDDADQRLGSRRIYAERGEVLRLDLTRGC